MKNLSKLVFVSLGLTLAGYASAAPIDVAAVVTAITDQIGAVTLVGGAVLTVVAATKAFKYVRAAM